MKGLLCTLALLIPALVSAVEAPAKPSVAAIAVKTLPIPECFPCAKVRPALPSISSKQLSETGPIPRNSACVFGLCTPGETSGRVVSL